MCQTRTRAGKVDLPSPDRSGCRRAAKKLCFPGHCHGDWATVLHLAGNRRNKLLAGERSTDVAMTRAGLARRGQD
jgi:hypothetical protein